MEEKFTKAEMEIVHKYLSMAYDEFITLYKEVMKQKGFINDHHSVDPWEHHEDYVVLWQNGRKYICPIYPDGACCLNPLYMGDDGKPHLSTSSIGGNVYGSDIAKYNAQHGIFNKVHHYASLQCLQAFSTRDTEENVPY